MVIILSIYDTNNSKNELINVIWISFTNSFIVGYSDGFLDSFQDNFKVFFD